jgi:hypothetical protein
MKGKITKLIHDYEKRLREKNTFLQKTHNSHVEGIAIQLAETLKDLKRIVSEQ